MQRSRDMRPYLLWRCYTNGIAFLASLPILFSTASGQQGDGSIRPPRVLSSDIVAAARPMPLPECDSTATVSRALVCQGNADANESKALVHPVALERLPPVDNQQATAIFGAWKSFASNLRLHDDGRIQLDVGLVRRRLHNQRAMSEWGIAGRFETRGDMLLVNWDDGSHSEFRWQLAEGILQLTDASGQMSQLHRTR